MKKRLTALLTAVFLSMGICAFAEPDSEPTAAPETVATESVLESTAEPTADPETEATAEPAEPTAAPEAPAISEPAPVQASSGLTASSVDLILYMQKHPLVQDSFATIELYSVDDVLLDTQREWVGGITDRLEMHFNVPQYTLGQSFKVKLVEGLNSLQYYDTVYYRGDVFYIETYHYIDDNGESVCGNSFIMTGDPIYKKAVVLYNQYGMLQLSPAARLIDGVTYVPVRQAAENLGLSVRYDGKYNSVAVNIGNKEVAYNIGSSVTNFFGKDKEMNGSTRSIDGYVFVPVRSLADAFETGLEVKDFGDHLDVIMGKSQVVADYYNSFYVNQKGIGSKTNYLIWVSKSEYKVRAYKGQQHTWVPIGEFTCAIGAPDTPTVTGQFDYFSRETSWDYDGYYVGPIMRFYNGYALHSTLLYYGGGEYDGRVGVQISHGCVRLHPQDINWLVENIPLYSRVWVTD